MFQGSEDIVISSLDTIHSTNTLYIKFLLGAEDVKDIPGMVNFFAQIFGQTLFWVFLWEYFWTGFTFKLMDF